MIELGCKVTDVVSGFTGIVVARYEYLYGCARYCVQPETGKDSKDKLPDAKTFDEPQLIVKKKASMKILKSMEADGLTGGPCPYTPDPKE